MKSNPKKCRGTGKALGYGCGIMSANRKFGLCKENCFIPWATETKEGKEWLATQTAYKMKKNKEESDRKKRIEDKQKKMDLISPDKYRSKYVQPVINKIARQIDYGNPCIATGNFEGKMAGGHYTSVGSNRTICLNLHNIFIQSFQSNNWKGGDNLNYRDNLINLFSQKYLDFIEGLRRHRPIKLTKQELVEIRKKAMKISNELSKNLRIRSSKERVELRNEVNLRLGIYDQEFMIFEWHN